MNEEWRDIPGYEGCYQASSHGQIRSLARKVRSPNGYRTSPGRVLKQFEDRDGYHTVMLSSHCHAVNRKVHHLVLEAFDRPKQDDEECCHKDGVPSNNCLNNLRWGSKDDNHADKVRHGTVVLGDKHKNAKLTISDVRFIRKQIGSVSMNQMAKEYGVSHDTIDAVVKNRTWKWVTP